MNTSTTHLPEDEFDVAYPLIANHLNANVLYAFGEGTGFIFETYGEELAFVRAEASAQIWTVIDGDDGNLAVLSGYHLVNRIGCLVSVVPVPAGITIEVGIPMDTDADG